MIHLFIHSFEMICDFPTAVTQEIYSQIHEVTLRAGLNWRQSGRFKEHTI